MAGTHFTGPVHSENGFTGPASASQGNAGMVKQAAPVADAAGASPTKAEFDALLNALRAAGILAV